MSTRNSKDPKIKASSEWAHEAPAGATALIVAECMVKGRATPIRRVALDWLHGDRNKPAPLRTAATKLPDTASLGETDNESVRNESDGSVSLSMSERCSVRWTIRSIPTEIITCWTGFEDGVTPAEQQKSGPLAIPNSTPTPDETKVAVEPAPRIQSGHTRHAVVSPAVSNNSSQLPTLAPMAALIFNLKEAFDGNCAGIEGKFVTDGCSMLLRSACEDKFLAKLKSGKCGSYGPDNPVPEVSIQKVFDDAVRDAKYTGTICGYVLGAVVSKEHTATRPFVCITGPGDRITVVDGHRLQFIQSATAANNVRISVDPESSRLTFYKNDEPVALLVTMRDETLQTLFQKMLNPEQRRSHIPSIAPVPARRAS